MTAVAVQTQPAFMEAFVKRETPTLDLVLKLNAASASERIGSWKNLTKKDGVLEQLLEPMAECNISSTLSMCATDYAHLEEQNPQLLERLSNSSNITFLRPLYVNAQPLIFPQTLEAQLEYSRLYVNTGTVAPIIILPGNALNMLAHVPNAPKLLSTYGVEAVLFSKSQDERYQPQGIRGASLVGFKHPDGIINGIVASKQDSETLQEYLRFGYDSADDAVESVANHAASRPDNHTAAIVSLGSFASAAESTDRFAELLKSFQRAAITNTLRVRSYDRNRLDELRERWQNNPPSYKLQKYNAREAEVNDVFGKDLSMLLRTGAHPETLLLLESEYRSAIKRGPGHDFDPTIMDVGQAEAYVLSTEANKLATNLWAQRDVADGAQHLGSIVSDRLNVLARLAKKAAPPKKSIFSDLD